MYIYQLNIILEQEENLATEADIENAVADFLKNADIRGEVVSSVSKEICGDNIGRCASCGCFTSDYTKADAVRDVSNGAKVNGKWLCDVCLPQDHPNAF